ncbi:hypothetical protein [Parachlamydia sp. AcF125]|uniref:hypothetical protein n=1 Tax=Parachlamydia sp. AcF125 TaxID=2795736 RepID=UPI001BCA0160|nr:hypothetical protein [Parachlamydia sp. AcF125]MBS4168178.1 hypothetical protein [Parachlamydia sp. AcF125]
MSNNFNSKPSQPKNSEKQENAQNQPQTEGFPAPNIEAAPQKTPFPMGKEMAIDFFESDRAKLANLDFFDLIDEVEDVIYHSSAQLIQELKQAYRERKIKRMESS